MKSLSLLSALILAVAPASAQTVLGTYNFNNTDGTNDAVVNKIISSQPSNATFSDFGVNGVTEVITGKGANNANRLVTSGWTSDTSFDDNLWVGFTITAESGYEISLSEISFFLNKISTSESPRAGRVQISNDGFATVDSTESFVNDDPFNTNTQYSFSLASLDSANAWSFRFQFNDMDPSVQKGIRLDTVALSGDITTAAIPEPSTFGLLAGVGALGCGLLYRCRRVR